MASRLSHELRTPMAIVKSSLDRLNSEENEDNRKEILQAADKGLQRLQTLLTRLSEAARLEQALQEADKQETDLNEFLMQCVDGYQLAYPAQVFKLITPDVNLSLDINRDLFFQMLDKLISNAIDFSYADKEIKINLINRSDSIVIQVVNFGPRLPEDMLDELFNSMVSVRSERSKAGPHLGLGLFVAKLISEFHNGKISTSNLKDEEGVCINITF
jgi:signal transduction histidine kinase